MSSLQGPSGPRAVGVLGRPGGAAVRVPMTARGRQCPGSRADLWAWEHRNSPVSLCWDGAIPLERLAPQIPGTQPPALMVGSTAEGSGVWRPGRAPAGAERLLPVIRPHLERAAQLLCDLHRGPQQLRVCAHSHVHRRSLSAYCVPASGLSQAPCCEGCPPQVHRPQLALLRLSRLECRVGWAFCGCFEGTPLIEDLGLDDSG